MQWWIDEPVLLGTHNPDGDEMSHLIARGVKLVISLLDEAEQAPRYDVVALTRAGVRRISIPIQDFTAPTVQQMQEFVSAVVEGQKQGPVVVHCQGGSGRTGTMAAAYWISKGLSVNDAIHTVRRSNRYAVETEAQLSALRKYTATSV